MFHVILSFREVVPGLTVHRLTQTPQHAPCTVCASMWTTMMDTCRNPSCETQGIPHHGAHDGQAHPVCEVKLQVRGIMRGGIHAEGHRKLSTTGCGQPCGCTRPPMWKPLWTELWTDMFGHVRAVRAGQI